MTRLVSLFIQKEGSNDDTIDVLTTDIHGTYKVVFSPNDCSRAYTFYMNQGRLVNYLEHVLQTLTSDVEPFEHIQVASYIAPSVVYEVDDLIRPAIRNQIIETVSFALSAYPTPV